jgi:hypothetical protein
LTGKRLNHSTAAVFAGLVLSLVTSASGNADMSPPGQQAPTIIGAPTISGEATLGSTLTADRGTWDGPALKFSVQWERCDTSGGGCSDIGGSIANTYDPVAGDVGSTLRVAVTATNQNGSAIAVSAPTAAVSPTPVGAPAATSWPAISGTTVVGQTLSASTGSWSGSPSSYTYQWRRCDATGQGCVDVTGATAASYLLASDDVGFTMTVAVTAANSSGSATAVSSQTLVVVAAPSANPTLPASFFTAPAGSGNVVPSSGAFLGLWTDGTWTTMPQNVLNTQTQLGRKLNVLETHYGGPTGACYDTAPLSPGVESWAWGQGVYSLVSWSPGYTIAQVNSGAYDACFTDVAQRFKAFGHPIWLRMWWEFNGTYMPWKFDPANPQPFIDAWQRVVNIFKSVGATNTMFVWSPDEGYFDSSKTLQANGYPGDAYVDWVASDQYNWNNSSWCGLHAGWCDFWEMFHHGYSGVQAIGVEPSFRNRKPYLVAETGSLEDTSDATHKGQWMQNMDARIKSDFPDLRMLLYSDFDLTRSEGVNWRIDTSSSSLAGFKALAQDSYFNP